MPVCGASSTWLALRMVLETSRFCCEAPRVAVTVTNSTGAAEVCARACWAETGEMRPASETVRRERAARAKNMRHENPLDG